MIKYIPPNGDRENPIIEYDFTTELGDTLNIAEIRLENRYPTSGFAQNKLSTMIVKILKGSVTLVCGDEKVLLLEGSVACVPKNVKYYWFPKTSQVTLYIVSGPAWTKEQAVNLES